jgi:hypothetical protein
MFVKVEPLDRTRHADLTFKPADNYRFAEKQASSPLPAGEVIEAARFYPVVFQDQKDGSSQGLIPQALLSLVQGKNAFVDEKGMWRVAYIPAHIRRYPFILGTLDQKEQKDQYAIMIDVEAPQFKAVGGEPLFVKDGDDVKASQTIETAREFLGRMQAQIESTASLLAPLEEQGILVSRQMEVTLDGRGTTVSGFRTVDEDKLRELDDKVLAEWTRNGLMNVVFAHLHSLAHVRELARLQPEVLKELPPQPETEAKS